MTRIVRREFLGAFAALATTARLGSARAPAPATLALVQINQQAIFFNQMNSGAQAAAKEAGVTLVIFNANDQPTQQNDALETYTQQKVQGIIVDAIDVNGIMPAVQSASAAGIPVIGVDSILPAGPQKTQVGVDNDQAGRLIGTFFVDYVKQSMGGRAKLGIVGALNSSIQNIRQAGFESVARRQPSVQVAGVVDGRNIQDNALTVAETLLTGNPDLTAIYATGEPALLGAIAAVNSQGRQGSVKIFGWDLTAQAIAGIDDGSVVAVVQQDSHAMGVAAVNALLTLRQGGTVPKSIPIPITIVTKANVQPYRAIFK